MDKNVNVAKSAVSRLPVISRRSPDRLVRANIRKGLRRSKSVSDLRPNNGIEGINLLKTFKRVPVRVTPAAVAPPLKSTSTVNLGKRPAEGATADPKPKIIKGTVKDQKENAARVPPKQRIPPYDYKARFNALTEKFEKFKSTHKNCAELANEVETIKSENECMSEKLQRLEPELEYVTKQRDTYKANFEKLKKEVDHLKTENAEFKEKYSSAYEELIVRRRDNERNEQRINDLENTVRLQSKELQSCHCERRMLHNLVQELKGNIRVFCRVRPPLPSEDHRITCNISYTCEKLEIMNVRASNATSKNNSLVQEFIYDYVFPPESLQSQVFEELDQLIQSALDGYNICVFAYGQTGSGKTYTMQGDGSENGRGMIPRSVESLFRRISQLNLAGWKYEVQASFLEIYNETIRDLLNPTSKLPYEIKYNEGKGVTITNLEIAPTPSENELKKLIESAERNRSVAITDYNEHSSRSHAVTKIYLRGVHEESKTILVGSINLVDLAGSENAKRSANDRITETKHINKSLAALGNVMLALHNKDNHVPYRDSKLTYLLGSCLGGNSKTLMFVNICPFEDCHGESINALRFAAKVKEVKANFKKNRTML